MFSWWVPVAVAGGLVPFYDWRGGATPRGEHRKMRHEDLSSQIHRGFPRR